MKVLLEIVPEYYDIPSANEITLPQGLIGFGAYKRADLLYISDQLPFLWMKLSNGKDTIQFVVIEPGGVVRGYDPEIFDGDAEYLGIKDPSEAMVLNIVTLLHQQPVEATVNLVGPIVVNRRTRIGRQLVISNYSRYSAHHSLVENTQASLCARTA